MTIIIKCVIIISIKKRFKQEFLLKIKFSIFILIFSIIISLSLCSCKNNTETKLVYTENDTIKQTVKDREKDITWTQELEGERLSQKITRSSMEIGAEVPYSKELFKISKSKYQAVYPDLMEFGSLDTRDIRPSIKEKLNNFCKQFSTSSHKGTENFFSSKYIYNYVFFVNDLEEGWEKNFGQEYPAKNDKEKSADIFTRWIFGEPFIGAEIMQIPVRFYASCGIIDVTVFINIHGNNEFYQITINRWKKV